MGCKLAVLSQTQRKLLGFYWIECRFWPDIAYIKHCYTQKFYCSYSSFISQCLRTGKFHGVCCLKHSLFDNWKGICMLHDTFKLHCKVRVKTSWWLLMVWRRLGIRTSATNMMIQYGQYIYIYQEYPQHKGWMTNFLYIVCKRGNVALTLQARDAELWCLLWSAPE